MATTNQLKFSQRIQAPTPPFFKTLRTAGLLLAATSGAVLGMPAAVLVPALVTKIAGYVAVAGGVLSAVSQTAVEDNAKHQEELYE